MHVFLDILIYNSISMSVVTLIFMVIMPVVSKRYTAKWCYICWIIIGLFWVIPCRPLIDFLIIPIKIPEVPIITNHSNSGISTITGDIVYIQAFYYLEWMLPAIWLIGALSISVYHFSRHRYFIKMIRRWSAPMVDLNSELMLKNLSIELNINKSIELRECKVITSPMMIGFFHPVILLPPLQISDTELLLILKHELVHFKRYDLWYKTLILTATVLHWFNPIVYLMAKKVVSQCEFSCDEIVLQGADLQRRRQYGEAIIKIVKYGSKFQTVLSTNFYGGKQNMKNRLSLIMNTKQKKSGIIVLGIIFLGALMTGATLAAATDSKESTTPGVIVANPESNSVTDNKENHLRELLRNYHSNNANSNDLKDSYQTKVVIGPPNSDKDSDTLITPLKELLKKYR
ncbi:M56 family metallopeptidase [Paenibacillus sp. FSL R7-0179]|uniref:M56 family metallopeptidase n=1 Tax=Paenibacillus sp. FSL R7-0179 TaxID=2921672 RepID=UPI0030F6C8B8